MSRRLPLFVVAAVALTACEGEGFVKLGPPVILVNVDTVAFGQVPVGFQTTRRVTVVNAGELALEISRLATDGAAAFTVSGGADVIAPGQELELVLSFAPTAVGALAGRLVVESNASNASTKAVPLTGEGVPAVTCGDCATPPAPACLSADDRVTWAETGTCVMGECEYTATVVRCAEGCVEASGSCRGEAPDAGFSQDAEVTDTGVPADTGVPDTGTPDTGAPDTGAPDTGAPDTGAPDTGPAVDAGIPPDVDGGVVTVCSYDAGVTDAGLGAPSASWDTAGEYSFIVPSGVSEVLVRAWGGGGQGGNQDGATGGGGAFVQGRLQVSGGELLRIWVAQGGSMSLGNGGGASYVRRGTQDLVVAGGGGGGGSDGNSGNSMAGGAGGAGGPSGESGQDGLGTIGAYCTLVTGGAGATATGPGAGGVAQGTGPTRCDGQPGDRDIGGRATGSNGTCQTTPGAQAWRAGGGQANGGGGGGGAGYFGGGGAGFIWTYCGAGGGGGASYTDPAVTAVVHEGGARWQQGRPTESSGAGRGGERCRGGIGVPPCTCNSGAPGRVELYY